LADVLLSHEYLFEGTPASGLGVASIIEGLAVSIDLCGDWDRSFVPLVRRWIALDGDGELQTIDETVPHASHTGHVQHHIGWIEQRLKTNIVDGTDLWQRRTGLFPGLQFCDCVRAQILSLTGTHIMLQPTIKRLFELDRYCRDWTEGGFKWQLIPSKASPESESTLNEHQGELTFHCPDGVNRVCHWHVRMTPDAWRLHFFPDPETRTIIVGRIGRKPFG
jgi:desulfoferrodoxin (superoxide reductase-like protein)